MSVLGPADNQAKNLFLDLTQSNLFTLTKCMDAIIMIPDDLILLLVTVIPFSLIEVI